MARQKNTGKSRQRRKVKDKGDEAEMRTPTQNEMALPSSDDIMMHFRAMKGAKERLATVTSLVRNCRKAAKAVNPFLPQTIDELMALERSDDPSEFRRRMQVLAEGLRAAGSPYQLTVHDTLLGDVSEAAFARGQKAGAAGMPMANPYPETSDLASEYARGWIAAQANMPLLQDAERQAAE